MLKQMYSSGQLIKNAIRAYRSPEVINFDVPEVPSYSPTSPPASPARATGKRGATEAFTEEESPSRPPAVDVTIARLHKLLRDAQKELERANENLVWERETDMEDIALDELANAKSQLQTLTRMLDTAKRIRDSLQIASVTHELGEMSLSRPAKRPSPARA